MRLQTIVRKNDYDFRDGHSNHKGVCNSYDLYIGKLGIRLMQPFGLSVWWNDMQIIALRYTSVNSWQSFRQTN